MNESWENLRAKCKMRNQVDILLFQPEGKMHNIILLIDMVLWGDGNKKWKKKYCYEARTQFKY